LQSPRQEAGVSQLKKPRVKAVVSQPMDRNVRAVAKLEEVAIRERTPADRLSDAITRVAGSAIFVACHAAWFAAWIAVNVGFVPGVRPFDPFPFAFLTLVVSLEAIFLAIFVLMSQNRMSRLADRRAHIDLQIDLLAEREVTAILKMLRILLDKQGVSLDRDVLDLLEDTDVTALATDLDQKLPAS
jgi:uncharacterized membrane protein